MKRLTIISHTEHYLDHNGQVVGLASTVREIHHLLQVFESIEHVAMLHQGKAPDNTMAYESDRIRFVPIPAVGGQGFKAKLGIFKEAARTLQLIKQSLAHTDYFQFRAPTGIGIYMIPYLLFRKDLKGWFKYAGNWKQEKAPISYQFQRWLLKHQSRPVTINGVWEDQEKQIVSFENPCLTKEELKEGKLFREEKRFVLGKLDLCFVGRLEEAKGLDLFFEAVKKLSVEEKNAIRQIHVVGTGERMSDYKRQVNNLGVEVKFYGLLDREALNGIYKQCHGIVLPSASEGFPKVIAEAMNYGCVPIVSNVSSLEQYIIDGQTGFVMKTLDLKGLLEALAKFLTLNDLSYEQLKLGIQSRIRLFSYTHYNKRIEYELL